MKNSIWPIGESFSFQFIERHEPPSKLNDDDNVLLSASNRYPNILNALLSTLEEYNRTSIPPANLPLDKRADPRLWENTWTNFGDQNQ